MKTFYTCLFTFYTTLSFSQTKISGSVKDAQGISIPGANIFLWDTYDGATSDATGKFEFSGNASGDQVLVVRFIGYKEFRQTILLDGSPITLNIKLQEEINELEAVTITAGSFTASDVSRRTVFRAVDIATTAGATADIAGALNTLPGTQKVGESGRLFVRGGEGYETKTFIDGMLVLDAYGPSAPNTPTRGRFLPFMFKGTSFSTGGYSAEYGQALSSALVLDSKDESELTRTDIGILSVGGDVTHTQAWNRGSLGGKIQYTNIRPYFGLINQEIDWNTPPASLEGIAAFRQRIGKEGMIKFYGNFNHSNFSLYNHSIDDYAVKTLYDLTNNYRYANAFYKDALNQNWSMRSGLSYTYLQNETGFGQNTIHEVEKGIHAKTVFDGSLSDRIELKIGGEVIGRNYVQDLNFIQDADLSLSFDEWIGAGFAEADLYATNKFVSRGGLRFEYNAMINQFSIDPRISLAYKTGKLSQVSFAYGKFRQTAKNEFIRINEQLNPEKAEHFILNYQRVENNKTFRIETYYKRYDDLIKYDNGNSFLLNNEGSGFAKGIELFWRDYRSVRNLDYWISYSFLDTKRDYRDFPYEASPSFSSRNNFSIVTKYFIQKIKSQLGSTFSYTSGRSYHNPNEDKFNGSKTPSYQDLSFNWSYLPKPYLILYFSCTNLLGRDNIFGYEYSTVQNESGLYNGRPIRQAAPRFVFLGIFITLSKDKSMNQLPSL